MTSWLTPANLDGDFLEGDVCLTRGCRRQPKNGALFCDPCGLDADDLQERFDEHTDRLIDDEKEAR